MGNRTRHFYILMIVLREQRLFQSDYSEPVNIGSDEQVSRNQMLEIKRELY